MRRAKTKSQIKVLQHELELKISEAIVEFLNETGADEVSVDVRFRQKPNCKKEPIIITSLETKHE